MSRRKYPGAWQRVGIGRVANFPHRVYEARRAFPCAGCGRTVTAGERFTRWAVVGHDSAVVPFCAACRPFMMRLTS